MENKTVANTGLVAYLMEEEYKHTYINDAREWVWLNSFTGELVVLKSITNYFLVKRNVTGLVQLGAL